MKITEKNLNKINFDRMKLDSHWNDATKEKFKMHKIHVYPAKFPSFMVKKALTYAKRRNLHVNYIGDIFCGCGTTVLEAKKLGLEFWGCDINPVAALITRVKSRKYKKCKIKKYTQDIIDKYESIEKKVPLRYSRNERIRYWYNEDQIKDLYKLLWIINKYVPKGKYNEFFLCAFSNILKPTSRWLTKSIKPQVDNYKKEISVGKVYKRQVKFMIDAVSEIESMDYSKTKAAVLNRNFLDISCKKSFLDLIITSPPYVTSYEYADLHQLSSLWLGYCRDYRSLRKGSIGSLHNSNTLDNFENSLNKVGLRIYNKLKKVDMFKAKAVAKYFIDMEEVVKKSLTILKEKGMAIFVVGNTRYKGILVNNAKYLTLSMLNGGYKTVNVYKRKINSKILTPYRSADGKFSSNKKHKKIYGHEFVVVAKK